MTLAAEQVMKDIQALPPEEQRQIWQQLSQLVLDARPTSADDADFERALDEVTGCTAHRNATGRLLDERRGEREREQLQLQERAHRPVHG